MMAYLTHLRRIEADENAPRNLRFCDGTMQRYLESRWLKETPETRGAVTRATHRMSDVPSPRAA